MKNVASVNTGRIYGSFTIASIFVGLITNACAQGVINMMTIIFKSGKIISEDIDKLNIECDKQSVRYHKQKNVEVLKLSNVKEVIVDGRTVWEG